MNRLETIKKHVLAVLEEYPEARNDDYYLYLKVLQRASNLSPQPVEEMTVEQFLTSRKQFCFPCFETVGRVRRKLQADFPELKATEETQAARKDQEALFQEYFRKRGFANATN